MSINVGTPNFNISALNGASFTAADAAIGIPASEVSNPSAGNFAVTTNPAGFSIEDDWIGNPAPTDTTTVNVTVADASQNIIEYTFTNAAGTVGPKTGGLVFGVNSTGYLVEQIQGYVPGEQLSAIEQAGSLNPNYFVVLSKADLDTVTSSPSYNGGPAASALTFGQSVAAPAVITIAGTVPNQATKDTATIDPFSGVTISDTGSNETESVTVTLSPNVYGALSALGGGTYNASQGKYTVSGSAAAVTAALDGLVFTPVAHQAAAGSTLTTTFTIAVTDSTNATAQDGSTTVVTTETAAPSTVTVTGGTTSQTTTDTTPLAAFAGMTIADSVSGQTETVTVTLSPTANGTLTNLGGGTYTTSSGTGTYVVSGSAAAVTTALDALTFTPTAHQAAAGSTETTNFTIAVTDTAGDTASGTPISVTTTETAASTGNVAIAGTKAGQLIASTATIDPFSGVTISDSGSGQTETVTVTLSPTSGGTLSNLGGGTFTASSGTYTVSGTPAAVTTALDALVFTPGTIASGHTSTTNFTISVADTANATAKDTTTSVIASAAPPTISGMPTAQSVIDGIPITVLPAVTIADGNPGQTETVTITLSGASGTLADSVAGTINGDSYSVSGSAAAVTSAVEALVFTPAAATQNATANFAITVTDSAGLSANAAASVTATPAPAAGAGLLSALSFAQQLELIYVAYFNRAADNAGDAFWSGQNQQAQSGGQSAQAALTNVANSFAPQTETITLYPFLTPLTNGGTIDYTNSTVLAGLNTFIGGVYQNLFNRAADTAGQTYWVGQISGGAVGLGAAALAIANGATGSDVTEVLNKLNVAVDFTTRTSAAGIGSTVANTPANFKTNATSVMSGVDNVAVNDASVTAAESKTTQYINQTTAANGATSGVGITSGQAATPITISASFQTIDPGAGDHTIQFLLGTGNDTLVLHAGAVDQIANFDPSTDVLDLGTLLTEANVDLAGGIAALAGYVSVADNGADAVVSFDPTGHGGGSAVAVLAGLGQSVTSLQSLTARHAIRVA